jgi:hypothetical protein
MPDLPVTNLTGIVDRNDVKVQEIIRVIAAHITFNELEKFHRPITIEGGKFPACYVQPNDWDPTLEAVALQSEWGQVTFHVYQTGNAPDRVGEDVQTIIAMLDKLFSRNALNDIGTPAPTGKYFANAPFWVESKFGPVRFSPALGFMKDSEQTFLASGTAVFRYRDVIVP